MSRSNLNGQNIRRLFTKPDVEWPNGITIDHIAERIYWVDARLDYIASSDLEGRNFKKIISHDVSYSHQELKKKKFILNILLFCRRGCLIRLQSLYLKTICIGMIGNKVVFS